MYRDERGFTAISMVMMMGAAASLVLLANNFQSRVTAQAHRSELKKEVQQIEESIRAVLDNRTLCDHAIRQGGGFVKFDPDNDASQNFNQLQLYNAPTTTSTLLYSDPTDTASKIFYNKVAGTGDTGLEIQRIYYRHRNGNPGNNILDTIRMDPDGGGPRGEEDFLLHDGEIGVSFTVNSGASYTDIFGGGFPDRLVPVTTMINATSFDIEFCSEQASAKSICHQMGGRFDDGTGKCETSFQDVDCEVPAGNEIDVGPANAANYQGLEPNLRSMKCNAPNLIPGCNDEGFDCVASNASVTNCNDAAQAGGANLPCTQQCLWVSEPHYMMVGFDPATKRPQCRCVRTFVNYQPACPGP